MRSKVLIVHPGTQHAPKLAKELALKEALYAFATTLLWTEQSKFIKVLKVLFITSYKKISNRVIPLADSNLLITFPFIELLYLVKKRIWRDGPGEQLLFERNRSFQTAIPDHVIKACDVIIGFDTSSWIIAERAKSLRKVFILDQTIAHPTAKQEVYNKLKNDYAEWKELEEEKDDLLIGLETSELLKADKIVVASTFTKNTLIKNNIPADKIVINPYGVDLRKFFPKKQRNSRSMKFLFVGTVNARKGIPFLLQCWKTADLGNSELWLVGPIEKDVTEKIDKSSSIKVFGKIPHLDLQNYFNLCDVFVFPSYFEGFGLVILEAMASGLPVITTTATAGPDIIDDEIDGFIIEPGDQDKFIKYLEYCYQNPANVFEMGIKARNKAEKFTWEEYGRRWINLIESASEKNG